MFSKTGLRVLTQKLPEGNYKRQALKYAVHTSSVNLGRETDLETEGTYSS